MAAVGQFGSAYSCRIWQSRYSFRPPTPPANGRSARSLRPFSCVMRTAAFGGPDQPPECLKLGGERTGRF